MSVFQEMIARAAQAGRLDQIWLRPQRLDPPEMREKARITASGIEGDHARPGKRAVTLIQREHLPVIGAMLGRDAVDPSDLRRNLVISGLNLNALKGRRINIGSALLLVTGICAPCSRMEQALGPGGYSAMRGHGGWCAEVIEPGEIAVGDAVTALA